MIFRQRFAFIAVSVFAFVAALLLHERIREPAYQGKRLSAWLMDLDRSGAGAENFTAEKEARAEEAIRQMGAECIPVLLDLLRSHNSRLMLKLIEFGQEHEFAEKLVAKFKFSDATAKAELAKDAFMVLGEKAKPAIPELMKMLNRLVSSDWDEVAHRAGGVLGNLGKEATLPVVEMLNDTDVRVRRIAANQLRHHQTEDSPELAVPALLKALHDSDITVRVNAAKALGNFSPQSAEAVPALLSILDGDELEVRLSCIRGLALTGAYARRFIPALTEQVKSSDSNRQSSAVIRLARIRHEIGITVPALIQNLQSTTPSIRGNTTMALSAFGPEARGAIPHLQKLTNDQTVFFPGFDYSLTVATAASRALQAIERAVALSSASAVKPNSTAVPVKD
ncbi:MAG: HEAT repeat domain-containing protein [Verrucomicrobia bacterium]|nr:HEAT repeat domain-containing protein [Verrucomicrobiota bacterium]